MFSEAVDVVVERSGRLDRVNDIKAYINTSIRECQVLAYFARDLIEDTITATASPHVWTRPTRLRLLRTVRYPNDVYPDLIMPGKRQQRKTFYYYGGPTYYAFAGALSDADINVAYYLYSQRFTYYAATGDVRPAVYDRDEETWAYLLDGAYVTTLGTDALDEAAEDSVSMWLLLDWFDLIIEGGLAKLFKQQGDERGLSTFALYKSFQSDLKAGEVFESLDR